MTAPADLSHVRSRFPALAREQDGTRVAFLDAPGGSHVAREVIDAMAAYLATSNANVHGVFATSVETDELVGAAHRASADLLNADPGEVIFGPNATTLLFALSRSIGRTLSAGDEVVVTRLDHDANIRPWVLMAEDAGATVRWADVHVEDVTLDERSFVDALSERTRVVAFTLASNAVGTITPAERLIAAVRERAPRALVACDGVHLAQHRRIDVRALGADLVVCSPYKIFGPHLGIAFARHELLAELTPYKVRPAPDERPFAFETGTQSHEAFAGWIAAVDYVASLAGDAASDRRAAIGSAFDAIRSWEASLSRRFLEGVATLDDVELHGIGEIERIGERTPTFAVRVRGEHPTDTAKALAERGIYVWDGHYYALEVMERLGLQDTGGAVRVGFCHYNTYDEVDRLLGALAELG